MSEGDRACSVNAAHGKATRAVVALETDGVSDVRHVCAICFELVLAPLGLSTGRDPIELLRRGRVVPERPAPELDEAEWDEVRIALVAHEVALMGALRLAHAEGQPDHAEGLMLRVATLTVARNKIERRA